MKTVLHKKWSTHMPIVIKLVQATTGPVMELGAGLYSTPLLHWLCAEARRKLVSYESVEEFYKFCKTFQSRNHRIKFVNDWRKVKVKGYYSVILIDHTTERRFKDAIKWKNNADYIILHDSNGGEYQYDKVYPYFKYIYHWKFSKPWTTVVSNFKDLSWLN
jgi:hypothetical protein